jgi:propionyl-CoA synthetase
VKMVREKIGPVAAFKTAAVVESLPKTRSVKFLRASMGAIADSVEYRAPATIEDPAVLDEIEIALQGVGYAQK